MKLPKDFENYFSERWRREDVEALVQGLSAEPSVSIRVNPCALSAEVEPEGADGRVPWCPEGYYLKQRPSFTADPLFHAGAYYVQEASSMFLAHLIRSCLNSQFSIFNSPLSACLDLCAAPGGKSTLLRSLLPDDCLLVSNEPNRARCQVLAENMAKWGGAEVLVTQAYARDITRALRGRYFFDLILADVPCSGEGMMRKEEEAVRQWSPAFITDCATLQRSIIRDIWPALRPGGILIYSTCTFNPEEDEDNVEWIAHELGADIIPVPVDAAWRIRGDLRKDSKAQLPVAHFLPGQVRGEGFFCAVLQKHESSVRDAKNGGFIEALATLPQWPTDPLDATDVPHVELSLSDAIRYLQREALTLPPETPRGIVQVTYHGRRLGLMKNLGSRANNLYPKEWRIRSSYIEPHTLFSPKLTII